MTTRTTTNAARKPKTTRGVRPALTNEVAARYLPRVQRHAERIARRLPRHVNVGDLVSAGFVGLIDAFMRFDTSRMESFDSYVDHRIRGAIFDELRDNDPLTRDQRVFVRRLAEARQSAANRLGRGPDEDEVATEMGLTLEQFRAQHGRMMATSARTEAALYDEDDPAAEPANDCPEGNVAAREQRSIMSAAVNLLPPRHRDVLRMHYDEGRTMREIGEALGVTESRVSQMHSEAVSRLRETLATSPFDA